MKKNIKLSLYNATCDNSWTSDCKTILKQQGMLIQEKGCNQLLAWSDSDLKAVNAHLNYADAVEMSTVWLRPAKVGVRLSPRRLYFHTHDPHSPIAQKESVVLGSSSRRPASTPATLLSRVINVGNILVSGNALLPCHIQSDENEVDILKLTHASGKNGNKFNLAWDLWRELRKAKAYSIPDSFKVIVVHDTSQPASVVHSYTDALVNEWLPEIGVHDATDRIFRISLIKALAQLKEVDQGNRTSLMAGSVFLVAISGKPGEPLPAQQKELLGLLDKLHYQYRVFSYANAEPKWSARAQVSSILQGAGGIPYQLLLPIPKDVCDCLIYGVDIGHDHRDKRISRVVVSVTDQYGLHLASVWMRQKLNEATASGALGKMLLQARQIALSETGIIGKASIVLRDGRIPSKRRGSGAECLGTYFDSLGPDTTVVECRKRGNPVMYLSDERPYSPAPAGCASSPENSDVRFICTHDAHEGLANVMKIHIPKDGDSLGIGLNTMCRIVIGLCYSPSLGLRPHLPGPIYWADGIGATGANQYQFSGQRTYEFNR